MEKEQLQNQTLHDDEIDLFELWDNLWQQKSLILLLTFISIIIASGYAFLSTPIYQGTAIIQVQQVQLSSNNSNNSNSAYFSIEPEKTTITIFSPISPGSDDIEISSKIPGILFITKEATDKATIENDIASTYELIKQRHAAIFKALKNNGAIEVMPTKLVGSISVSEHPIKPKKGLIISVAMVLGLMLGVFIALIRSAIQKRKTQGM